MVRSASFFRIIIWVTATRSKARTGFTLRWARENPRSDTRDTAAVAVAALTKTGHVGKKHRSPAANRCPASKSPEFSPRYWARESLTSMCLKSRRRGNARPPGERPSPPTRKRFVFQRAKAALHAGCGFTLPQNTPEVGLNTGGLPKQHLRREVASIRILQGETAVKASLDHANALSKQMLNATISTAHRETRKRLFSVLKRAPCRRFSL